MGPSPETILRRGRQVAGPGHHEGGRACPILPGSDGPVASVTEARETASRIGYPVLLKASAGGGGRGMRRVMAEEELENAYNSASSEALAAFGNGEMYLERLALNPRHVEVQVVGDRQGNVVHLFERECSVQRRHQKLIEESPSPALSPAQRAEICKAGVRAAQFIDYHGAGTVEFLLDRSGEFYFMEMNARIQVEHPVTEMLTSRDLIKEQIRVAGGQPLSFRQDEVETRGHAIECRINAEDPDRNFAPCPGRVENLHLPGGPGIRVETHLFAGAMIPPYYDSMVAKVLAHGEDREEAILRMRRALGEFSLEGVKTTVPLALEILEDPAFTSGNYDTGFLDQRQASRTEEESETPTGNPERLAKT